MKIKAPAKINLYLKVLGKREDGFHELLTLMAPVSLFDEIELEPTGEGVSLHAPGSGCEERKNIAYRAAELFLRETGAKGGVHIDIVKNIPVGAGLGGGSSDGAAVLMGMNDLFGTGLSTAELMDLAARIGSDCPFFILREPRFMGGRGEIPLQKAVLEERSYLIVVPPLEISTALVYFHLKCPLTLYDKTYKSNNVVMEQLIVPERILQNDLEDSAFGLCPEIEPIKKELLDAGALGVLMSGSGSSVFGVFRDNEHICYGMSQLRRHEGYRYIPTTSLTGVSYGDYRGKGVSGQG
ncbi:MAG TPA: 4-(cytidine 5'-diphospho)-2-C-methyl-D-erythritol kinase [Deltaproteobacteria bacterium]|nr:4-(cytidine 5'-diphospho)-2-C-methyl-D-erythritol kinase [Deltaproteobacteria bacterium]HOI07761.1 4-(cytidine 5'-diphospho)-2-C-methyl-D-erythritol kinase [Deltaproteobacteria bacterium]